MFDVSADFLATIRSSFTAATRLTMETAAGEVVELQVEGGTATATGGTGMRWSAAPVVSAQRGRFLYEQMAAEGTQFTLEHGITLGNRTELVPFGVFTSSKVPGVLSTDRYRLTLDDAWTGVEEARFITPYQAPVRTRIAELTSAVQDAVPGVTVIDRSSDTGVLTGERVWDESRSGLIRDLANDGTLECYFDGQRQFIIRDEPALSDQPPAGTEQFTLMTGQFGTILPGAAREKPLAHRYNTVVVRPTGSDQTWEQQAVSIVDPEHPRHPSRIGPRPFFWSSPTITGENAARAAANSWLQRILKAADSMSIPAVSNAALEPGDVGLVVYPTTSTDRGIEEPMQIRSIRFNLREGQMDVDLANAALVQTEDVA